MGLVSVHGRPDGSKCSFENHRIQKLGETLEFTSNLSLLQEFIQDPRWTSSFFTGLSGTFPILRGSPFYCSPLWLQESTRPGHFTAWPFPPVRFCPAHWSNTSVSPSCPTCVLIICKLLASSLFSIRASQNLLVIRLIWEFKKT